MGISADKRKRRLAAGQCPKCGNPLAPGRALCEAHLRTERLRQAKRRAGAKRRGPKLAAVVPIADGQAGRPGHSTQAAFPWRAVGVDPGDWPVARMDGWLRNWVAGEQLPDHPRGEALLLEWAKWEWRLMVADHAIEGDPDNPMALGVGAVGLAERCERRIKAIYQDLLSPPARAADEEGNRSPEPFVILPDA